MTSVLDSVRDVVVVNSNHHALKLSLLMRDGPPGDAANARGGDGYSGYFALYRHPSVPEMVLETVISPSRKEGITSVYRDHRIFESRAELMRKRTSLIAALAAEYGLSAEAIGIDDASRGRPMALSELATGQLIDLLQDRARGGIVTKKTDNYAVGVEKAFS